MSTLALSVAVLLLAGLSSGFLLVRDVSTARLRARVQEVRCRPNQPCAVALPRMIAVRPVATRGELTVRLLCFLRCNPDIPQQNVIAWQMVAILAGAVAAIGVLYGRASLGWPVAVLLAPIEGLCVARFVFGWERARFQKVCLEQIPDVMGLICRAVGAGIPLSEALRSVAHEAAAPSCDEFTRVVNDVTIGLPLEAALWKLHERTGLPEYAFFAVTIGLQAQTGGSLVETLENLQDLVRKRVALAKRGKALAAEARVSAIILGSLPVVMCVILYVMRPDFFDFFIRTPSGIRLTQIAVGLMTAGIIVMRQLIRRSLAP